jgi:hypothetical protein
MQKKAGKNITKRQYSSFLVGNSSKNKPKKVPTIIPKEQERGNTNPSFPASY